MARAGCLQSQRGGGTGHVALREGRGWVYSRPVARGEAPQVRREVREQWVRGVKREEEREGTYLQVFLGCI